jgi:integrase
MNAATLRHTFGSLLLRSGKTYAQVAAAMGNSESTVREHYARLGGHEVDVDFEVPPIVTSREITTEQVR